MNDAIQAYWTQLVTFAAVVAAFVRSEIRAKSALDKATNETKDREVAIDKLEARIEKQRLEDREQAHRDYADLREMMRDVQSDVKKLLQREA